MTDDMRGKALQRGAAILAKFGEGRWGNDIHRGLGSDGPLTHSVADWAHKLGVKPRVIELALAQVMRKRVPLREPMGLITFACLELLRTEKGCDVLYRIVAEEIEHELRIRRFMGPRAVVP